MPGEEKESEAPKVVKKVKKIKKAAGPAPEGAAAAPAAAPVAPAIEKIGASPPPPDISITPVLTRPADIKEAGSIPAARPERAAGIKEASAPPQPHSGFPAPVAPPPKAGPPKPAVVIEGSCGEPRRSPTESKSIDSRIGSIDIDKLTSELEKDILKTLTSEFGDILAAPAQKGRKEVRGDTAAAPAAPPPRAPAGPPSRAPEPRPESRAWESEQRERRVAQRLGREFDKLPVNMRNELIKTLARTDDVKVREDVVIAIASNFEKLPPEVRAFLRTLANDKDSRVREEVAFELNRNFSKITPEYRNDLIPVLVKDVDVKVREDIVGAIASHYDRLPPEIRGLLKQLASDHMAGVRDQVSYEILRNADKIPEMARSELSRLIEETAAQSRERQ